MHKATINAISELLITATIITGTHAGTVIDIPRIIMSPSDKMHAVKFTRRQFPVQLPFAFTINKAPGQTLKKQASICRKLYSRMAIVRGYFKRRSPQKSLC